MLFVVLHHDSTHRQTRTFGTSKTNLRITVLRLRSTTSQSDVRDDANCQSNANFGYSVFGIHSSGYRQPTAGSGYNISQSETVSRTTGQSFHAAEDVAVTGMPSWTRPGDVNRLSTIGRPVWSREIFIPPAAFISSIDGCHIASSSSTFQPVNHLTSKKVLRYN